MSVRTDLEIPGVVTFAEGSGGLPKLLVDTPWSSAEIYLHGAQVTRFQKKGEAPLLFLSKLSDYRSTKPIRGGVPIIFPWFGPREGLPAHGFARTVAWEPTASSVRPDGSVGLHFRMPAIESFDVEFIVSVGETLAMELFVRNTGEAEHAFETCLHTYFQISSIHDISITGLRNEACHDRMKDVKTLETAPAIRFDGEMDRVYFNSPATVEIHDPGLGRTIRVEKSSSQSTVVWNPWIEKSQRMPDFGDDEYLQMVCVESGNIANNQVNLPPGECAVLKVVLSSAPLIP